ncbi:hypothetical protein DRW07_01995 [Alteromonas sediminis]|uniref:Uncharacterized protein n=1 Tax=Alteromonas sediminis TaxID=2259342 RepID=A0A3N5Y4T9_9ALTE|nr:hypothetical protein [Alteromonas sediminis]RPJ68203.1 hypothetical protein DRW07_01995 [Alteromonas sediminis]
MIFDITDGVLRTSGEMWSKLRERAGLGRNEWHSEASKHTNRVLSSANNLSAVCKDKRNMPLHDIVPMLKALSLNEVYLNHYVREFLKRQLPAELSIYFNAPDQSRESLLLREVNACMENVLQRQRTECEMDLVIGNAMHAGLPEEEIYDPNQIWHLSMEHGQSQLNNRRAFWKQFVTMYYSYLFEGEKAPIQQLNHFLSIALPENWKNVLESELNCNVLQLQRVDASYLSTSWIENSLSFRPLRSILAHLLENWQKAFPEDSERHISAWSSIPLGIVEQKQINESNIDEAIKDFFSENQWDYTNGFSKYLERYIGNWLENFHLGFSRWNPLRDVYGVNSYEKEVICNYVRYAQFSFSNSLSFQQYCDFGFPKAKQTNYLAREFCELILFSTLRIEVDELVKSTISKGIESETIRQWLTDHKAAQRGINAAMLLPDGASVTGLTPMTVVRAIDENKQARYFKRLCASIRKTALKGSNFINVKAALIDEVSSIIAENHHTIVDSVNSARQREMLLEQQIREFDEFL